MRTFGLIALGVGTAFIAACADGRATMPRPMVFRDLGRAVPDHGLPQSDFGLPLDLGQPDLGPPPDAGPPSTVALGFDPTNLGSRLAGHAVYTDGDLSDCTLDSLSFNTDTGTVWCRYTRGVPFEVVSQSGGPDLAVFFFADLVIPSSSFWVTVRGSRPLVIVASGSITVLHLVSVDNGYPPVGPTGYTLAYGNGPGGGGASSVAGEGGAHCTLGGLGSGMTMHHAVIYGSPGISPLESGSSGGIPSYLPSTRSGAGGGAIQLVAGRSITVGATGALHADGDVGTSLLNEAGHGSGGAILLEAPSVTVMGSLTADGGRRGRPTDYSDGTGGSGRIRINTASGVADVAIDAITSPVAGSPCYSLGTLLPPTVTLPPGPTCAATPATPSACDLCLDRGCCAQLTACIGSPLCDVCRTSATPGPACATDPTTIAYRACRTSYCPTACVP